MRRIAKRALPILACLSVAIGLAEAAEAQKRVAFVVGTDKYDNLDQAQQLQRAVNDARSVGAAFKALSFDVIAAENLTRAQFNEKFQSFLDKLAPGDTAAMYYAGHGVEIEGLNFLLPRDVPNIRFGRQEQVKRESLSLAELLLDLRGRSPEITLVILDACRDNPLVPEESRSAGGARGGLAALRGEPPRGTFIMYSAGAGETALDRLPGSDPDRINSIFTRKLLPLLVTQGLALHDLARQLRADVLELASKASHTQRPAYYDGVIGKYCLAGCGIAADAPKAVEQTGALQRLSEAAEAWSVTAETKNMAVLEAFIARYKDTFYAELARARVEELRSQQISLAQEGAASGRSWLGIKMMSMRAFADDSSGTMENGALVADVASGSPAARAGIRVGDTILKFDGEDVLGARSLPNLIARNPAGKYVDILIQRNNQKETIRVALGRVMQEATSLDWDPPKRGSRPSTGVKAQIAVSCGDGTSFDEHFKDYHVRASCRLDAVGITIRQNETSLAVVSVDANSDAGAKGIAQGSQILEMLGSKVSDVAGALQKIADARRSGVKEILLRVQAADGKSRSVTVRLK